MPKKYIINNTKLQEDFAIFESPEGLPVVLKRLDISRIAPYKNEKADVKLDGTSLYRIDCYDHKRTVITEQSFFKAFAIQEAKWYG